MSDRGSILISTANDIGEALVEKLGGEGYAPSAWDKEYNKLGIAEVDSAPALSVLEDSSSAEPARGSILLSTANAIGAVLNKKYYTDRGFKPKEWASAASKLAPLPEKSAESAPICAIEDGSDDVPSRSLVVTIPPTLTGISAVTETQTGKNLLNDSIRGYTGANIYFAHDTGLPADFAVRLKAGTYTYSVVTADGTVSNLYIKNSDTNTYITGFPAYATLSKTFTLEEDTNCAVYVYKQGYTDVTDIVSAQIEVGSSASDYEAYQEPTTHTASLGRTIYGGQVDIVNGEGTGKYGYIVFNGSENWGEYSSYNGYYIGISDMKSGTRQDGVCVCNDTQLTCSKSNAQGQTNAFWLGVGNKNLYLIGVYDSMGSTLEAFKTYLASHPLILVYPLATEEDFTFTGQEVPTRLGYNAFWSEQGNTALDYYGEPEPYTRGTASGAIANVQSARTDLPFTMVKANIAPNLTGVESVEVTKIGKNLFNKNSITENSIIGHGTGVISSNNSYFVSDYIPVKEGATYYFTGFNYWYQSYYNTNKELSEEIPPNTAKATIPIGVSYIRVSGQNSNLETAQLEVGESATEYTPYAAPTTYTADLGEPVYGGYADLVSGEVVKDCTKGSMSSTYLSGLNSDYIGYEASTAYFNNHPSIWVRNWNYQTAAPRVSGGIKCACNEFPVSMHNTTIFSAQYRIYFDVYGKNITSVQDFIDYVEDLEQNGKSLDITYEVADPTESSITPQVISPSTGVNNLWNNAGGDTDVEYFTQE